MKTAVFLVFLFSWAISCSLLSFVLASDAFPSLSHFEHREILHLLAVILSFGLYRITELFFCIIA